MIVPIEHDGEVLGYIIMGQIRKEKDFRRNISAKSLFFKIYKENILFWKYIFKLSPMKCVSMM